MRVRLRNPDRDVEVEGPLTVAALLDHLDVLPHTVLVLHERSLVTAERELPADAEVEVRPVISGGADSSPRCVVCRAPAVLEERRHRAAWCPEHLGDHVQSQIRRAIDHVPGLPPGERMFSYGDRLLVAVSGGKDSLALWDALHRMGYQVDGLYLGLGIGGYSARSREVCERFATARGLDLHVVDLAERYGYTIPHGAGATGRATCGVCGLSKRYEFNRVAVEHGYDVLVTGHNLDDEAATLLGNVLRWHDGFLARQHPVLPATGANQVRKVKPLYRLSERETAAYCVVEDIDYIVEECPLVDGNTGHELKAAFDVLEAASPGLKAQFLFGFLERADRFVTASEEDDVELRECRNCGMPTTGEVCAFCRQRELISQVLPLAGAPAPVGVGGDA
ncbi:MAG: ATP-binding protein [Nitriliruptoraceae bacterium]